MSDKLYFILICSLVAVVSVLGVLLIQTVSHRGSAMAETAMGSPGMLAVTGRVGSGTSVLYVIDTANKSLAVYSAQGANRVRFVGARRIKYDFELRSYNDTTPKDYGVDEMSRKYRESMAKEEDDKDGKSKRR